jgi:hypothetical protein
LHPNRENRTIEIVIILYFILVLFVFANVFVYG